MIFIAVKLTVRPEYSDSWIERTAEFTAATRAEEGNLFTEWFRSVDNPNEYLLVEGFTDEEAGAVHRNSEHVRVGLEMMSKLIATVPRILRAETEGEGWSEMAELSPKT
ncbi:putative quinol monooxygenase [Streptomyces sp. URMC 126]|uniref:putative quinol monooxygenase n=1 Tax=Streptomyces sp. URMC 126 TaxID=3423401 RepID=UPI003F198663